MTAGIREAASYIAKTAQAVGQIAVDKKETWALRRTGTEAASVRVIATGMDGTTKPLVEENYKMAMVGTITLVAPIYPSAYSGLTGGKRKMDRRIQYVLENMKKNYRNHWSLSKMAAKVDLSPSRFGHLFKQEMGQSFKAYLKNLRLQKASELLQRPRARILEVAHRVGYADPSNFSRDFRKHFRETPRKHRHKI